MRLTEPGRRSRPARVRRGLRYYLGWLLAFALVLVPLYLVFRVQLTVAPGAALKAGTELLAGKKVLAVVGHPDDLEWYIGGTLRRLSSAGADVQVVWRPAVRRGQTARG